MKRKPATLRGSLTRPRISSSSNSAIHDRATRCAFRHVPFVICSLKTPNVSGPPGSNG